MSAFSPRQMFHLDLLCQPLAEAFQETPYLVGTATTRQAYRDVDVRLILPDDRYDALAAIAPDLITFLGIAIGDYLRNGTSLPVDFQIQRQTEANKRHSGPRNPLGVRALHNFRGDAAPDTRERSE